MTRFLQDLQYSFRQFIRQPGFAVTAIVTMAIGIGASTAVFSVLDAALLRPLPFAHQERLVSVNTQSRAGYSQPASLPGYRDMRQQLSTFAALAGFTSGSVNLETAGDPVVLPAVKTTDNFFDVFGVNPLLGRTFRPGEDQPGQDDVVVLSYEVWQSQFGGRDNIVGSSVRLDGAPYNVIGVMPAGFRYPLPTIKAVYTPLHANPKLLQNRHNHWLRTIGLLKEGVDTRQATEDLKRVLINIGQTYADSDQGRTGVNVPLAEQVTGKTRAPLLILALAVLTLLVIACVNVAGLLLARGVQREREIALRAAVGASRSRLLQQLITESLSICTAGLFLGLFLAFGLLAAMKVFVVKALARGIDVHIDLNVLLVAMAITLLCSMAAGLAPALRLSGTSPSNVLRAGGNAGTGRAQHRLRSSFIVTQIALSLVLVVVSGVLMHNLQKYLKQDMGFEPGKVLAVELNISPAQYANRDPLATFYQPVTERVQHLPGVIGAGMINILPVQNFGNNSDVHITGQPPYPQNQEMLAEQRYVTPGYFDAMGIHLLRGRALTSATDNESRKAGVIVVNQAFQRKFMQGADPVGAHIDDDPVDKTEIVGLTTNVRQNVFGQPLAEMDYLVDWIPVKVRTLAIPSMFLMVRTQGDPAVLTASIRSVVHDIDPTVPFKQPSTMADVMSTSLVFERMQSWLFGIFAGFALLLSLVGIYAMVKHEVERGTRDIGVRMALGSTRARVLAQILQRVGVLMLIGLSAGWIITLAAHKVLATVVQINLAENLSMLGIVTIGLGLIGVCASVFPARRAASINPIEALRTD